MIKNSFMKFLMLFFRSNIFIVILNVALSSNSRYIRSSELITEPFTEK